MGGRKKQSKSVSKYFKTKNPMAIKPAGGRGKALMALEEVKIMASPNII